MLKKGAFCSLSVPHLRETNIPPQGGKSGWAGPPSSRIGPWFRHLKTIAEAQNLIPEFEVLYNWVITQYQEEISCKNIGCDQLQQHALLYVESVWEDWGVRYDTSDKRCLQFARKELQMMILIRSELPKTHLITYIRESSGNHLEEEWFFGGVLVATLRTYCKFYVVLWVLRCFEYLALETPGSKVFYLGAALGTTVSHVSNIVGLVLSIASVLQLAFQSIGVVYGDITILDAIEQVGGIYVVTADHGNAEDMVKRNKKGEPLLDKGGNIQILTSHTLQPVPVAIGGPGLATGIRFRKDVPNGMSLRL